MSAKAVLEIALYAGMIPAVVALLAAVVFSWSLPVGIARRYVPALPFALAVFVGYACLRSTESLIPAQFSEWSPCLGMLAALIGGITAADGISRAERWLVALLLAVLAAWLIVPTWDDLTPSRVMQITLLAGGMFLLAAALAPLGRMLNMPATTLWLVLPAATVALLVMAEVSETLGTQAALPAGALLGCAIARQFSHNSFNTSNLPQPYAIVVLSYAYTGYVYPAPPLPLLLLVPFAPLALWICTFGPLKRPNSRWQCAIQALCILAALSIIATMLILRAGDTEF